MIRAAIFDLDGTLLDTLDDLAAAANQALIGAGLPPQPSDDYRLMIGDGARNLMLRAISAARGCTEAAVSAERVEDLLNSYGQAYEKNWDNRTRVYPGIYPVLYSLSTAGIKLAVLSNKPEIFTQKIIGRFFPADCFAAVSGNLEGWPIKPDPTLALEICRRLGISPQETAMVGDSGSDMTTACRAGMLPIGALWGFRSAGELTAAGAKLLVSDPAELIELLTNGEMT